MTSIVVHGITIPVGKSLNSARTMSVQRSTEAPSADLVSRLPPAVPLGASSLPISQRSDSPTSSLHKGKAPEPVPISADERVRFDLNNTGQSGTHSRTGSWGPGVQWSDKVSNGGSGHATPVERVIALDNATPVERAATPEQLEEGEATLRQRPPV